MAVQVHQLIINLNPCPWPGLDAQIWAAPLADDGQYSVVTQKITAGNAPDFGIVKGDPLDRLIRSAEALGTEAMIRSILRNPKKLPSPEAFCRDEKNLSLLRKRSDRMIDKWLSEAVRLQLPVTVGMDRMGLVSSHQLHVVNRPVPPALRFKRTADGMTYRLGLRNQDRIQPLLGHTLQILSGQPAWIILDRFLIQVEQISGQMLKPFTQKEEVHIPEKLLKTYVQKFLMKVSQLADVETEGFEIRKHQEITGVGLRTIHHVLQDETHLGLEFDYGGVILAAHSDIRYRQGFSDPETGPLVIDRYERQDAAEVEWHAHLDQLGLHREHGGTWRIPGQVDLPGVVQWLIGHKPALEDEGIAVHPPIIPEGQVILAEPTLTLQTDGDQTDWFDLHATVEIDTISLPLVRMARTILDQKRFHTLGDGQCFLVPESWLATYRDHFLLGEVNGDALRISRAQAIALKETHEQPGEQPDTGITLIDLPTPATLNATLRPYQLHGFRWLAAVRHAKLGACLADDMGLGKTVQTIAFLLHVHQESGHDQPTGTGHLQLDMFATPERPPLQTLIILPASLVFNWKEEIRRFAPHLRLYVHTGPDRYQDPAALKPWDIVLTTYALVVRDQSILTQCAFSCMILDESQQIKNHRSQTFQAVHDIRADFRLTLTGTPVENSLSDLWAQMQFINPGLLGPYPEFRENYQRPIEKGKDKDRELALRQLVRPFLLRRRKEEVAPDLPPLTEQVVYCEMDEEQASIYEAEKSAVRNLLLEQLRSGQAHNNPHVLNALMRLRQIAIRPAIFPEYAHIASGKEQVIRDELENLVKSGQQALVYSAFRRHLQGYAEWMKENGYTYTELHGGIPPEQRGDRVHTFQEGRAQFFLATLKAGGAGLNLTAAEYILLADPWWNPAVEAQAVGRGHRIGQDKPVFALRFITRDTIEEKILTLQERKLALKEAVIEEEALLAGMDRDDLFYLVDGVPVDLQKAVTSPL